MQPLFRRRQIVREREGLRLPTPQLAASVAAPPLLTHEQQAKVVELLQGRGMPANWLRKHLLPKDAA